MSSKQVVNDSLGRSHASVISTNLSKIASAFAGYEFPKRYCLECGKEIPFLSPKGRLMKGNFCYQSTCRYKYKRDQQRTKPKVNRGVKRPGL